MDEPNTIHAFVLDDAATAWLRTHSDGRVVVPQHLLRHMQVGDLLVSHANATDRIHLRVKNVAYVFRDNGEDHPPTNERLVIFTMTSPDPAAPQLHAVP